MEEVVVRTETEEEAPEAIDEEDDCTEEERERCDCAVVAAWLVAGAVVAA